MKPHVLLIDDDQEFIQDLLHHLGDRFEWETLSSGDGVLDVVRETLPDVILLDIDLGGGPDGFEILSRIREEGLRIPVVMVTRHDPTRMAARAWELGSFGYIEKGSRMDQLAAHIERAVEEAALWRENRFLREEMAQRTGPLVGESPAMKVLREQIRRVAATNSTVLIVGESGTGKDLVAREIHRLSSRGERLFVAVNCAALPRELVESELFGHEKGAFTGAVGRRIGKFEEAHRGTLLLDEVSETSGEVQAKLLRVLQDRRIVRVGGTGEVSVDVRVIAATNQDLESLVSQGAFRQDLYYRLRVVPLEAPPLREKKEDIPLLARTILERKAREMNRGRHELSPAALDRLVAWDWPGNVRELENVLENALVHSPKSILDEDLFVGLVGPGMSRLRYADARARVLERFENDYLTLMLRECSWNVTDAARRMGLTREGLRKMMGRRGVKRPAEKPPDDSRE